MANTKQARKRARQTVARNLHLAAQRSQYRTAIKKVRNIVCIEVNQKRVILHLALDRQDGPQGCAPRQRRCTPQEPSRRRD